MRPRPLLIRWLALLALLAGAGGGACAEVEIPAPTQAAAEFGPPHLVEDPARPADAPTPLAIQAALDEGSAANAVILADRALKASRIAYGPADLRTLAPLINLAHARLRSGDLTGALADYRTAIELGEREGGPREPRLFNAWYGVGYAHQQAGRPAEAREALETALQLHRVNQGLYSAEQLDVLGALAEAWRAQGRVEKADTLQETRVQVAERVYGPGRPELAQTYLSAARWYRSRGRIVTAVQLQSVTLNIIERAYPKDDPRLIDPLLEVVSSASLYRPDPDDPPLPSSAHAGSSLTRANRIAEAQTGVPPEQRALTLIRIADVNLLVGRRDSAYALYAKAESLLATAHLPSPLAQPGFIRFEPPSAVAPLGGGAGFLLAEFTVDAQGRARDIRVIETQPASLPQALSSNLVGALRQARLRPRISAGRPIALEGVRFRLPVREGSA